jgi:hypothetical protein
VGAKSSKDHQLVFYLKRLPVDGVLCGLPGGQTPGAEFGAVVLLSEGGQFALAFPSRPGEMLAKVGIV